MVMDHLGDDEVQEFLGEDRIQTGIDRQGSQPLDLGLLSTGICWGEPVIGLEMADPLSALESLCQKMHQGGIDVVYRPPQGGQFLGHIWTGHSQRIDVVDPR